MNGWKMQQISLLRPGILLTVILWITSSAIIPTSLAFHLPPTHCARVNLVSPPVTTPKVQRQNGLSNSRQSKTKCCVIPEAQLLKELAISGTLAVVTDPLVEIVFKEEPHLEDDAEVETTLLYGAADSISNAARIYFVLMLFAWIGNTFELSLIPENLDEATPKITFTIWAVYTISTVKRTVFLQKVAGTRLGRVKLYDQLIDFVLFVVTSVVVIDELKFDIGMGFQSIFAASGFGALAFSLASKDLAEQIVGGVILQAWDAFEVGEDVKIGDVEGTVKKIGLVETELAQYDNVVLKIPNSSIINQRVSNISRTKQSRVQQILRFNYDDIDKVPQVLIDIKEEILANCPHLITDGSKPFAAVLSQYKDDHIQTIVTCHFDVNPFSDEFGREKEQVLLAIARATSKNSVKFAIPAIRQVTQN